MRRLAAAAAGASALGVLIAVVCLVCADSAFQFVAGAVVSAAITMSYAVWAYRQPRALLTLGALLVVSLAFVIVGENIVLVDRIFRTDVTTRLILDADRQRRVAAAFGDLRVSFEPFGNDPLFYRRTPSSHYRESYDGAGRPYDAVADEIGFLNPPGLYTNRPSLPLFVVGDSVVQGIGMPGVVEVLRARKAFDVFSLATTTYGPRQKREALRLFAFGKAPRWLVFDFYSGNDASEMVEDDVCAGRGRDYYCRFDTPFLAAALAGDERYAALGRYLGSRFFRTVNEWKAASLSLALATHGARTVKGTLRSTVPGAQARAFPEDVALPAYGAIERVRLQLYAHGREPWVRRGLELTIAEYEALRRTAGSAVSLLLLYNPTSYEIYREILPPGLVDLPSDAISELQRGTLRRYADARGIAFCDLTDGFRSAVAAGSRGLFGRVDGIHWSERGRDLAAELIAACFETHGIRAGAPASGVSAG